jgi:integrase
VLEKVWGRIRTAAQLSDVRLHDLRHTVGTYAGQSGANAFLVRDLLRHKNLAMTGRYVNRSDDAYFERSGRRADRGGNGWAATCGGRSAEVGA